MRSLRMTAQEYAEFQQRKRQPKETAPPVPTHGELMKAVRDLLRSCGIEHYPNVQGPLSVKGLPDITAILAPWPYVGIEVKKKDDDLSPKQKEWRDRIERAGGLYIVAQHTGAVDAVIDGLGIRGRFLV